MRTNLIEARKKADLTQKELGNLVNVSERHINSLEAGTSDGSVPLWKALAKMFGCTIDYLLEQVDEANITKQDKQIKVSGKSLKGV